MRRTSTPVSFSRSPIAGPSGGGKRLRRAKLGGVAAAEVWPSKGVPQSALAWRTNWPPLGAVTGAAIDALQPNAQAARALPPEPDEGADARRRVQRIDLWSAPALLLLAHFNGERRQRGEAPFERRVAVDLAADVADDPAKPGAQEPARARCPLELMRMAERPAMMAARMATRK